jgi:hypothetical protein
LRMIRRTRRREDGGNEGTTRVVDVVSVGAREEKSQHLRTPPIAGFKVKNVL